MPEMMLRRWKLAELTAKLESDLLKVGTEQVHGASSSGSGSSATINMTDVTALKDELHELISMLHGAFGAGAAMNKRERD